MTEDRIATLLELIAELVHSRGTWQDKRDFILVEATRADKDNLEEFAAWFGETEAS